MTPSAPATQSPDSGKFREQINVRSNRYSVPVAFIGRQVGPILTRTGTAEDHRVGLGSIRK